MKQPPFPTKEDVVKGWIDLHLAPQNSPEYEESFWSFSLLNNLVSDFPHDAFEVVLAIIDANHSDPVIGSLSAGPVEDLLVEHGADIIEFVEIEAKRSPIFACMLGGVWRSSMDESVWCRLNAVWDRRGWDGIPLEAEQGGVDQSTAGTGRISE